MSGMRGEGLLVSNMNLMKGDQFSDAMHVTSYIYIFFFFFSFLPSHTYTHTPKLELSGIEGHMGVYIPALCSSLIVYILYLSNIYFFFVFVISHLLAFYFILTMANTSDIFPFTFFFFLSGKAN